MTEIEEMNWHDNAIHAFRINEGDDGCSGELILDIDYIIEWIPTESGRYKFRVSPAVLTFHQVTDLVISVNYSKASASFQPMMIDKIEREVKNYPNGHVGFNFEIFINWPPESFISFCSSSFTQTLVGEPILSEAQNLSISERPKAV